MRKLLAGFLLVFLAMPLVLGSLLIVPVRIVTEDANFWRESLNPNRLEKFARLILAAEPRHEDSKDMDFEGLRFDSPAMRKALKESLPEGFFAKPAKQALDLAEKTFLTGATLPSSLTVDLSTVRSDILAVVPKFAELYTEYVPVNAEASLGSLLESGDFRTRPNDKAGFTKAIATGLNKTLEKMPLEYTLPLAQNSDLKDAYSGITMVRKQLGSIQTGLWAGTAFVLVMLAFLASPLLSGRLRYIATGLLVPSIAVLAAGTAIFLLNQAIVTGLNPAATFSSPEFEPLLIETFQSLTGGLGKALLMPAAFGGMASVALFIAASGIRKGEVPARDDNDD